jgi:hypothetical protein
VKGSNAKMSTSSTNRNRRRIKFTRLILMLTLAVAIGAGISRWPGLHASGSTDKTQSSDISQTALDQIQALIAAKQARTPAQRKMDSNLLAFIKMSKGEAVAEGVPTIETGLSVEADGRIRVDVDATVTRALLKFIEDGGGEVINSFSQYRAIRARIYPEQVEALAGQPKVRFVKPAVQAETQRADGPRPRQLASSISLAQRAAAIRPQLLPALLNMAAQQPNVGAANSAGDVAHRAAAARTSFGINGSGVKIGVLSDSFDNRGTAAADILTGDLPGPGNPNGFTTPVTIINGDLSGGGSDEGRAMLQIVHDLAPGAQLFYATAFNSAASFATNIQALRTAGCDIIIDDVGYFDESPFQDAIIAQAVNTVTGAGALYFSSAGNAGNLNDNTAGVWEGDFVDSGVDLIVSGNSVGRLHDFTAGVHFNTVSAGGSSRRVNLFWSDPLAGSSNDYDLYVLNSAGTTVLRSSSNDQTGTQDPYEFIGTLNVNEKIAIVKLTGVARALHLDTGRGRLSIPTSGQTRGHNSALNGFGVAAVDASSASGGAYSGGATNPVETFSSDGTRRFFYNADGSAITPGNILFSTNGGAVRQKPDIAAADGVATTLPPGSGLNPFFGTSAAAPHAGAVAGLIKSFRPSLTAAQIRTILTSTALDIEGAGVDRDSGAGIVMAFQAIHSITPVLTVASVNPASGVAITVSPNDIDGMGNGTTQFTRTYNTNAIVTLTAPAMAGGNNFQKWQKDGVDVTTNQMVNVTMDTNHTMTAVYVTSGGTGRKLFDFDNDSKADVSVWRPSSGVWFIINSSNGSTTNTIWGTNGDMTVAADYDNDGKADIAVWRPSTGVWYIINSSNGSVTTVNWGASGDVPVPADYDGDGKADIAIWRPSEGRWYIINSSNGSVTIVNWGTGGDIPVPADYDNDGKADIAVWRPSTGTWYIINSSNGSVTTLGWGVSGDKPVAADYDNDGKADIAVWRPSTGNWLIINSSNGSVTTVGWGVSSDIAAPADYDGDGKADIAVWRPSEGRWYIINSSNGSVTTVNWGASGDIVIPGKP